MESETGPREAGLAPPSWPCFVLEWRIQAAGARADGGTPRDEGTLQPLGVGTVQEPVHEARAGRETEQAPLVVELVLAVEDAVVVVEVGDGAAADDREEAEEEGQREGASRALGAEEECEREEDSGEESEQGTQFEADGEEADEKTDDEESDEETGPDDDEDPEDDRPEADDDCEQDAEEDVAMAHEEEGEAEEEAVTSETEYMVEEEANFQEEEDKAEEAMEEGQGEEAARELQDKQQGSEHPEAGPSPLECPLEALEALRAHVEPTNGRGGRSFAPFQLRLGQRRHHRLQQRSAHVQGTRGFWAKAVSLLLWGKDPKQFGNHPQLSAVIREQDLRMLRFMTNLKVQDVTFPSACRRILLFFGKNSYFQNDVLVKEYVVSAAGYRATHSTPIQWSQSYEREAYRRQHQDNGLNFFNWFSGHHLAGSGRIAEVGPCDRLDHHGRPVAQCPQVLREGSHRRTGGASRCRDECEETAHLSTAIADVQMDTSGQHGSPA
ncbi:Testis-specific Y-encoded protein 9 [Vulpes lagopus]